MPRDPRYDILFEPLQIGPVTTRNRFYQVPHCTGMGYNMPETLAAMRETKAEGGWGVVCTEYCSIHPSSDDMPAPYASLWDEDDVRALALMTEAVHRHGALAGVQLWYGGLSTGNYLTREIPLSVSGLPLWSNHPVQTRAMDKEDIRNFRHWQVEAAKRARRAGFDIVYVYAGHGYLPFQFLSPRFNQRSDEYGGPLENRTRLLREMIEETREAVGESCAVAVRLGLDELLGPEGLTAEGEGREVVAMLAELPDLWDFNLTPWENDSRTARFVPEGFQEPYVAAVKSVTTKPVVGVGRFTSPDVMVSQIERGVLDLIGAARPSIADPFLPKKIEEGRPEDIRECIGCNICTTGDAFGVPIRCTQNPTMGEEWRRNWHPERIEASGSEDGILVVGAGPTGLECARALGQRGYAVHLVEAERDIGGRVAWESRLPGLATWDRVTDYRRTQIEKLKNVEIRIGARLSAKDILEYGAERVVIATGSRWRKDGVGRSNQSAIPGGEGVGLYTPEEVMTGAKVEGPAVVFDDDHYYMAGCLAEKLRRDGLEVTLVTPGAEVSSWTHATLEQGFIQTRLLELGVRLATGRNIAAFEAEGVELACVYTDRRERLACASVVLVTARIPEEALYRELKADPEALAGAGIRSVAPVGDCFAPGTIAAAVYAGHRLAREMDAPQPAGLPYRRERVAVNR